MESLYNILNLQKINIEKEIEDAISKTKLELTNLDIHQTCVIYTSHLYTHLKEKNILCYIVDTKEDLKMPFLHMFIVIPKDDENNYVLDMTYAQFGIDSMYEKGYQLLSHEKYSNYLNNILNISKRKKR